MKINPVSGPGDIKPNGTPESIRTAKAVAAFNKGQSSYDQPHAQPQERRVQNQNQISAEEVGAVKAQSNQQVTQESQDSHTGEVDDTTSPQVPVPSLDESKTQPEDPVLSRQFAQLSRQEKALRAKAQQQEQAYKVKEQALLAREAELAKQEAQYKTGYIPKETLKNNPLQALIEAEVSYDELTQQILNNSNPIDPRLQSTISKLEAKIQSLEKAAEEAQTTSKSATQAQYDSAVKQITTDVQNLVKTDPQYETIRATNSAKDVVDLIVRTYNEDGVLLSVEEAADEVENHILEEAVKLSRLSKVTKRMQTVAPTQTPKPQATQPAQSKPSTQAQPMKTLTNASASTRPLTSKERAMLAFKGEKF